MLEKDLINLGFEKVDVQDIKDTFYYYKLEVIDGVFLVSNTDFEAINEEYIVRNIGSASILINEFDELAQFISVLRGNTLI